MEKLYSILQSLFFVLVGFLNLSGQDPNLFLHFPFDGTVEDVIGNLKNVESVGGTPRVDRFGVEGGAYYFDGIDDLFRADFLEPMCVENGVSMSAWIKLDDVLGWKQFFSIKNRDSWVYNCMSAIKAGFASNMFYFGGETNYGGVYTSDSTRTIQSSSIWYHVAGTISSNFEGNTYINGELKRKRQRNDSKGYYFPDLDRIEMSFNSPSNRGAIDDLMIYNRVLTPCEINALANNQDPSVECPNTTPLECEPPDPLPTTVRPNPTNGRISIHVANRPNEYLIPWSLHNIEGQLVADGITNCNDDRIDLRSYPSGIYFIRYNNQFHKILKSNR